jgi:uncharacterized protein with HEPN domain
MCRDYRVYLDDILEATNKILSYTAGFSYDEFRADSKTIDAVIRNFMVIGEAASKIPDEIRSSHGEIQWRDMVGLRNIVIHEYFGIKLDVIWKVIQEDLPELDLQINRMLSQYTSE